LTIPVVKTIPTYLTLFIFGFLYQLVLVYDSLRLKNTIQVIGLCIYNLGMLIYAAVQFDQIRKAIITLTDDGYVQASSTVWADVSPFLVAVPCVIALGTVVLSFIAWKLYDEFAWTIYKHISADLRMKRRFLSFQVRIDLLETHHLLISNLQIYIALLKFDFFFFLGFTVQFLVIVTNITMAETGLTAAAIPITIAILLMAAFWTRRENKLGMIFIIVLYHAGLAYFIFKIVRMYQPGHVEQYMPVRKSLTVFAVIVIILILLTIANAIICMRNFDKGLKPHVLRRKIEGEEKIEHMTELPDLKRGPVANRMTID
jgi:hypothetical protein